MTSAKDGDSLLRTFFPKFSRRVMNPKQAYHFKIVIKVRAVNVVMSRNSEDFSILIFIDINFLCKGCSLLFKCHSVLTGLEERFHYQNGVTKEHNYINWSRVFEKSKKFIWILSSRVGKIYFDLHPPVQIPWEVYTRNSFTKYPKHEHSVLQNIGI